MLQTKLNELLNEYEPEIRSVVLKVLRAERAKLSYVNPRGILDEVRHIIEEEAERLEAR